MPWNERMGAVSRAFSEWVLVEREVRAFLRLSQTWSDHAYDEEWARATAEYSARFDPDRDDVHGHVDVFDDAVDGLWPHDYQWMLRAATVKDAVTAFEVYLERGLREVFDGSRVEDDAGGSLYVSIVVPRGYNSPAWPTLAGLHQFLGTDVASDRVRYVRDLRHLLTHQRGHLLTDADVARFGDAENDDELSVPAYVGGRIPLREPVVTGILDDLAAVVRSADVNVWRYSAWGGEQLADIGPVVRRRWLALESADR